MLWSFTYVKFYLIFNSMNGINNMFYLSSDIPIPVSIISVSNMWVSSSLKLSLLILSIHSYYFFGLQSKSTMIFPSKILYFTAFYMMLNKISWYITQSFLIMKLKFLFLAINIFKFLLMIYGSKGLITLSMCSSKFFAKLFFSMNSFFLIFIL